MSGPDITTVKGDKELADEMRQKILTALKPAIELFQEADAMGFEVGLQIGKNGFGKVECQAIHLLKRY